MCLPLSHSKAPGIARQSSARFDVFYTVSPRVGSYATWQVYINLCEFIPVLACMHVFEHL